MIWRRLIGALLSLPAPGSGHCLVGRERRGMVLFAVLILTTAAVPLLGAGALFAMVAVRFYSLLDVLFVPSRPAGGKRALGGAAAVLLLGIGFTVAVRFFYLEGYSVPTAGMAPTIIPGDHVMTRKFGLPPSEGEIIVYRALDEDAGNYIQRVVGRAGDAIAVRSGLLHIDGRAVTDAARVRPCELALAEGARAATCMTEDLGDRSYTVALEGNLGAGDYPGDGGCGPGMEPVEHGCRVPDGHLFVMGDQRNQSSDSREFGPVPVDRVGGVVMFIWWSATRGGYRWSRIGDVE